MDKLKKFFGGEEEKWKGKGKPNTLGASPMPGSGPAAARNVVTTSARGHGGAGASGSRGGTPGAAPPQQPQPPRPLGIQQFHNTGGPPPGAAAAAAAAHTTPRGDAGVQAAPSNRPMISSTPSPREQPPPPSNDSLMHADEATYHMQTSLALMLSHPGHEASLSTLARVLLNVVTYPSEAKYRQIKLSNAKVQAELVNVPGAVEFLQACGFEFRFEDSEAGVAQLPDSSTRGPVEAGWQELVAVMQANGIPVPQPKQASPSPPLAVSPTATTSRSSRGVTTPSSVAAVLVDRDTQVILPVATDTSVPDWFFDRTPGDLKEEFHRLVQRREQGEQFMTRAMRERDAYKAGGKRQTTATVRVRFPEGVCLQGTFGVGEQVASLFEWVSSALRSPAITYELVEPGRSKLAPTGIVRDASLAPACVINFRPTGDTGRAFAGVPLLSDDMLRLTQARY
ncbi:hypothetical protein FOA52_015751 [Chlamydomonas sp. UWO 241]|nr:hypothetical protein FOA52_015751 [Chlamydomonas sp. UWO 241]